MEGGVLAIDPKYFEITGGWERCLPFRTAARHPQNAAPASERRFVQKSQPQQRRPRPASLRQPRSGAQSGAIF